MNEMKIEGWSSDAVEYAEGIRNKPVHTYFELCATSLFSAENLFGFARVISFCKGCGFVFLSNFSDPSWSGLSAPEDQRDFFKLPGLGGIFFSDRVKRLFTDFGVDAKCFIDWKTPFYHLLAFETMGVSVPVFDVNAELEALIVALRHADVDRILPDSFHRQYM